MIISWCDSEWINCILATLPCIDICLSGGTKEAVHVISPPAISAWKVNHTALLPHTLTPTGCRQSFSGNHWLEFPDHGHWPHDEMQGTAFDSLQVLNPFFSWLYVALLQFTQHTYRNHQSAMRRNRSGLGWSLCGACIIMVRTPSFRSMSIWFTYYSATIRHGSWWMLLTLYGYTSVCILFSRSSINSHCLHSRYPSMHQSQPKDGC